MTEAKTYSGGCQCGAIRYEAKITLEKVVTCNCSRCQKLGSILAFIPAADFNLLYGADDLQHFTFNTHKIDHTFCKGCGIQSFARAKAPDGTDTVAINTRCLEDVDISKLTIIHYDGKSI
jgi:hypothetical protein